MDERFDKEKSETRYPRREPYITDGNTRYPVREERRPLRSARERSQTPPREETPQEQNPFLEYEQRMSGRRAFEEPKAPYGEEFSEEMTEQAPIREPRAARGTRETREGRGRSSAPQRKSKRRRKRHLSGLAKGLIVLIAALIVGVVSFTFMNHLMNPPEEELNLTGETVTITIPEGAGTEQIAQILKENKLIGSVMGFKLTSKLEGYDGTYKQGTYEVDTGLTKRQIMDLLQSGEVSANLKITIPEGYTVQQIAARV